jgi:flagellar protein FliO/FliZ
MSGSKQAAHLALWIALALSLFAPAVWAEEPTVAETYGKGTPSPTDGGGNVPAQPEAQPSGIGSILLRIAFYLGVVIVLIYLLLRFLARRQIGTRSGPFLVVGAMPLGNGKSLHAVKIGDTLYLLGVGENVTLIRQIPPGEEQDAILAEAEWKAAPNEWIADWFSRFRKQEQSPGLNLPGNGDVRFEEILAEKWEEVNGRPDGTIGQQVEERNRGERS